MDVLDPLLILELVNFKDFPYSPADSQSCNYLGMKFGSFAALASFSLPSAESGVPGC
jgi:hypothetical protein